MIVKQWRGRIKLQRSLTSSSMTSAHALPEVHPIEKVLLKLDSEKHWKTPAVVLNKTSKPRSYMVQTQNGAVLCRNRLQAMPLRPDATTCSEPQGGEESGLCFR